VTTNDTIELKHLFRRMGARTNEPRTCLWCGDILRPKYESQSDTSFRARVRAVYPPGYETMYPLPQPNYWETEHPETGEMITGKTRSAVLKQIEKPKLLVGYGDYGDNAFCGLRCGYSFGVSFAALGKRLTPQEWGINKSEKGGT